MPTIRLTKKIDAPPETVFAVLADVDRLPERIPEIAKIERHTPDPVGLGTRFSETRTMFGRPATETFEIVEFVPSSKFTLSTVSCGVSYRCEHTLTESSGGTDFEMTIETRSITLAAKLMAPVGWLFAGAMKKMIAKDIERLAVAAVKREAS